MTEYTNDFEKTWKLYPKRNGKRVGKKPAFDQWKKLNLTDRRAAYADIRDRGSAGGWPTYIRDMERYLKRREWEDDWTPQRVVVSAPHAKTPESPTPELRHVEQWANRTLLQVVKTVGGVDQKMMKNLVDLKNALVEDHGEDRATEEFLENLDEELSAMAQRYDREAKRQETAIAQERFRVRCGVRAQV